MARPKSSGVDGSLRSVTPPLGVDEHDVGEGAAHVGADASGRVSHVVDTPAHHVASDSIAPALGAVKPRRRRRTSASYGPRTRRAPGCDTLARRRSATGSRRLGRAASERTGQEPKTRGCRSSGQPRASTSRASAPASSKSMRLALHVDGGAPLGRERRAHLGFGDRGYHRRRRAIRPDRATGRCAGQPVLTVFGSHWQRHPERIATPWIRHVARTARTLSCGR